MNKENVISHAATAIASIVLAAIGSSFLPEYQVGIFYLAGVAHNFTQPLIKKAMFGNN